ncbi:MAG: hypothetical protein ACTSWN_06405 [Promethearchaeota archaeon]
MPFFIQVNRKGIGLAWERMPRSSRLSEAFTIPSIRHLHHFILKKSRNFKLSPPNCIPPTTLI